MIAPGMKKLVIDSGVLRHHFDVRNKQVAMKVVNQTLIADIDGEPYELISLVQEINKTVCKVNPNYANCELLGLSKATTDTLVADATTLAQADASATTGADQCLISDEHCRRRCPCGTWQSTLWCCPCFGSCGRPQSSTC